MPGLEGLGLQRALAGLGLGLSLVFVGGVDHVQPAVTAMKRGAVDFLTKPVDPDALRAAVASALRREAEGAAERAARADARARWTALSLREQGVCALFAQGMLIKQIAAELGVAASTVHVHRTRALSKLKVSTVAEVARLVSMVTAG
jgi:two-component system response regulator FixJ